MQLCEQGKLRLDDPVNAHLRAYSVTPARPDAPPVTGWGACGCGFRRWRVGSGGWRWRRPARGAGDGGRRARWRDV
jgi:hypothetical protein